jgi:hypothetical protein
MHPRSSAIDSARPGSPGAGGVADRLPRAAMIAGLVLPPLLALGGCAAGGARFTAAAPAGFWAGLWHGLILAFTFVISLFTDSVQVYEAANTGGWYDFGFVLGVCIFFGGSGGSSRRR